MRAIVVAILVEIYNRPTPPTPRRRGRPYRDSDNGEIAHQFWTDIRNAWMFLCGTQEIGRGGALVESTPVDFSHEPGTGSISGRRGEIDWG